jgi:ABC-type lipoprotein export system ATPase subunit
MSPANVRLGRLRLLAYRSCKDTRFSTTGGVTALIGLNGAGKTNLMHGILLMALPSRPRYRFADHEDLYVRRGEIEAEFILGKQRVLYKASIVYNPKEQTRDEVVEVKERWNFKHVDGIPRWINTDAMAIILSDKNTVSFRPPRGSLIQESFGKTIKRLLSRHRAKLRDIVPSDKARIAFDRVQGFREGISYYSASQFTNPGLCPTSLDIDKKGDLQSSPSSRRLPHTRFIFDLYRLWRDDREAYNLYISLVDDKGVGLINQIKWREVKFSSPEFEVRSGGRVVTKRETRTMIIPTVYVASSQLSFNQLSEGTLRTLAMLFYIVTDKSSMLLIEEPEVCVHHGLFKSVIEIIKEYGKHKRIILSTHSETVLDSLTPEQVLLVDKEGDNGTVVSPLSARLSQSGYEALKNYLSTSGNLGEYWRHRGF